MNKKIMIVCFLAVLMLLVISLTPAIGTNTTKSILSTAPLNIDREEAVDGTSSNADEPIMQRFSNDFDAICSETPEGTTRSNYLPYSTPWFAPGEFIIKFREEVDICRSLSLDGFLVTGIASVDILNKEYSVLSAEKIFKDNPVLSLSNVYKFTLREDADILSIVDEYNKDPYVVYAEPNYIYHIDVIPNDENFSDQWALHNTGQTGGTPDADIDAPEAWDIETGSPDVVIAVIDTGVDYNHFDLVDNIWINDDEIVDGNDTDGNGYIDDIRGWDFYENDSDPMDSHGHGTHCSGIASAMTNNGVGIAGVCWNCKIMPLKFGFYNKEAAAALRYAADNGADVVSMSWGSYTYSQLLHDALYYAYSKGVFLVASAGNDNTDFKHYPSGYDTVICVAATDHNDERAWFSNYGKDVDVAAPGVCILSTVQNNNTKSWSGTSMACPHVAGLTGLLISKNPCPCPAGMAKTMMLHTADEIDTDEYIGSGRINAYKALLRDPAIAVLQTKPSWKDNAKDTVDIEGCAWSKTENFQQYVLEYGRGKDPDVWTEMKSSFNPEYGVLFSWDTTLEDEGLYTIRLTVTCSDGVYTDKIWIVVNNKQNTIHVDADNTMGPWDGTQEYPFQYIRDGIDDQGKNDTVYVHIGTYYEQHISIEKTINLTGEDRDTTIVDGCGGDFIFRLCSSWNNINGFTITNSSTGINLVTSDCNTLIGNKITNNGIGIHLFFSSDNNIILGNTIIENEIGISIESMHGFVAYHIFPCNYNNISGNMIMLNDKGIAQSESFNSCIVENIIEDNGIGIVLDHSGYNDIHGNEITENEEGIHIVNEWLDRLLVYGYSVNNTIYQNNITNNDIGIATYFDMMEGWPSDNNIYHNNFINNGIYNAYDKGNNHWDNGYSDPFVPQTDGGNYWDDHIGFDFFKGPNQDEPGRDGIVDRPYKIPDGDINPFNNKKDMYPLMRPYPDPIPYNNNQASQSNPKSIPQQSSNQLFLRILERFLELFPLLRQIMGL